jgi:hypothetical protein
VGPAVALVALATDLAGLGVLAGVPEGGADAFLLGSRLSAGLATGLWSVALACVAFGGALEPRAAALARAATVANAALSLVSLTVAERGPIGALAQGALATLAFLSVPAWLLALGRRPRDSRSANEYHLVTTWRLRAAPEDLCAVFLDPSGLARWWRAAFLDVTPLRSGDASGVGRAARLHTKGWLPYTLVLEAEVTACEPGRAFVVRTRGDFVGVCVATLSARAGGGARVRFDWRLRAEKPLLRRWSWLLRPLFAWNHGWVMRQGRRGLLTELARRDARGRGRGSAARPARPTFRADPVTRFLASRGVRRVSPPRPDAPAGTGHASIRAMRPLPRPALLS